MQTIPPEEDDLVQRAVREARCGNKAAARELLEEATRVNPLCTKAWLWRASVAEDALAATNCLKQVLSINLRNPTALMWMETIRESQTELDNRYQFPFCDHESPADFLACPDCGAIQKPDLEAIRTNEGADSLQLRSAIQRYKDLPDQDSTFDIQYFLGLAQLNLLHSSEALRHFKRASQIRPGDGGLRSLIAALERRPVVMVIDQSSIVRMVVSKALEREAYRAVPVASGADALSCLDSESPDLVLLDVSTPLGDGYEFCNTIERHPKTRHVPVVLLAGGDSLFDEFKGRMAGAVGCLAKPIQPQLLLEMVREQLERSVGCRRLSAG